jgi:Tfp pilus assembly protein PilO
VKSSPHENHAAPSSPPGSRRSSAPGTALVPLGPPNSRRRLATVDIAGLLVCILVLAGWYGLSIAPLRDARAQRNALLAELHPRREKLAEMHTQARSQETTLASVRGQILEGQLQLLPVDKVNRRLADITAAAREHGLRLDEIRPGEPAATRWFMTVPMRLLGSGDYPDIGAFLHWLPSSFPDVAVVAFEIRGEPESLDKAPRFVLNLVWYAAPSGAQGQN